MTEADGANIDQARNRNVTVADALIATGDDDSIDRAIRSLDAAADGHEDVVHALAEAAPASIPALLRNLAEAPVSPRGRVAAAALGQIGGDESVELDPQIVPALARAIDAALARKQQIATGRRGISAESPLFSGTGAASTAVAAVLACARRGPVTDALTSMEAVIRAATDERDPYIWAVMNALQVLHRADPEKTITGVRHWLEVFSERHPLHATMKWFLELTAAQRSDPTVAT